jgi:hypothetical protein
LEAIPFTFEGGQIQINGFPDAVQVIAISSAIGKRLADLTLHRQDLRFAQECLESINRTPSDSGSLREALWRSAIVHFTKCFGKSKARESLRFDDIYGNTTTTALANDIFNYFKSVRDKHVVHDENALSQVLVGALLNDGSKPFKIEKIICLDMAAIVLEEENYSNLCLLTEAALEWVTSKFDEACNEATAELEAKSYDELKCMNQPMLQIPKLEDVHKRRS